MIIIKAPILFEIQDFQERSGRISMQITLSSFINFIEKNNRQQLNDRSAAGCNISTYLGLVTNTAKRYGWTCFDREKFFLHLVAQLQEILNP